jgi:dethiobiotin synthetase
VGKTLVSLLLLAALQRRGLRVLACKPVETGCQPDPLDALALAALNDDPALSLDDICPFRFEQPVAPQAAGTVEIAVIRSSIERLRQRTDLLLVESAGGIGTPYAPGHLVLDLALQLDLPVLLVARDMLGTVGQTLVALRLMAHEGVRCLGVLLCRTETGPIGPEGATHLPLIKDHARGVPVLGSLPFIDEQMPSGDRPAELRQWARKHRFLLEQRVDLDRLL